MSLRRLLRFIGFTLLCGNVVFVSQSFKYRNVGHSGLRIPRPERDLCLLGVLEVL